jgi:hypothetical protein
MMDTYYRLGIWLKIVSMYSEIFLINNCQCQNEVKNHTVPS